MRRAHLPTALITAGGLAMVLVGSFLPWYRSGRRARSSYLLFDIVERLDLLPGALSRLALAGWLFVPLAAAGAVAAVLLGKLHAGAVVAVGVGLYTAVLAFVVSSSTGAWEAGTAVAACGGIVAMLGGFALLAALRQPPSQQAERP
jgi:hypothetical protein